MCSEAEARASVSSAQVPFQRDVVNGLRRSPRSLPCKYFYDEHGSRLFDAICELEEYYPTRTELAILRRDAQEMASQIGRGVMLIEPGSGSSLKTRILLNHLEEPAAYVPVDISCAHLDRAARELSKDYPNLEVLPVCADFTSDLLLPKPGKPESHRAVFFPGSTIGNFAPEEAKALLKHKGQLVGMGGGLLIGIDLVKDRKILEDAYNDASGVTAAFNLNLLRRINRELDANFDLEQFEHTARFNAHANRIEMYLVSRIRQPVELGGERFTFARGEEICTEHSHKYTVSGFARMAESAGFELHKSWTDDNEYFALLHLVRVR